MDHVQNAMIEHVTNCIMNFSGFNENTGLYNEVKELGKNRFVDECKRIDNYVLFLFESSVKFLAEEYIPQTEKYEDYIENFRKCVIKLKNSLLYIDNDTSLQKISRLKNKEKYTEKRELFKVYHESLMIIFGFIINEITSITKIINVTGSFTEKNL